MKSDGRVFGLLAHYEKEPISFEDSRWDRQEFEVGVDSGQEGIFDFTSFKKDELVKGLKRLYKNDPICPEDPWYSFCCDRTLAEMGAGVIPGGAVSSSGYGDGVYTCSTVKSEKKVIGILIDYGVE